MLKSSLPVKEGMREVLGMRVVAEVVFGARGVSVMVAVFHGITRVLRGVAVLAEVPGTAYDAG